MPSFVRTQLSSATRPALLTGCGLVPSSTKAALAWALRRLAVAEAINDYFCFSRMHRERVLKLIKGGAYVQGY